MWNDTVTKLPRLSRETRRLSDGHVNDVEAICQRVDAIDANLKFRKLQKQTLSQHEIPVSDSTSLRRRVLHAAREVLHALQDDHISADRRVREGRTAAAPARDARRRAATASAEDATASTSPKLRPRAALPPASRSRRESAQRSLSRIASGAACRLGARSTVPLVDSRPGTLPI